MPEIIPDAIAGMTSVEDVTSIPKRGWKAWSDTENALGNFT